MVMIIILAMLAYPMYAWKGYFPNTNTGELANGKRESIWLELSCFNAIGLDFIYEFRTTRVSTVLAATYVCISISYHIIIYPVLVLL